MEQQAHYIQILADKLDECKGKGEEKVNKHIKAL